MNFGSGTHPVSISLTDGRSPAGNAHFTGSTWPAQPAATRPALTEKRYRARCRHDTRRDPAVTRNADPGKRRAHGPSRNDHPTPKRPPRSPSPPVFVGGRHHERGSGAHTRPTPQRGPPSGGGQAERQTDDPQLDPPHSTAGTCATTTNPETRAVAVRTDRPARPDARAS